MLRHSQEIEILTESFNEITDNAKLEVFTPAPLHGFYAGAEGGK